MSKKRNLSFWISYSDLTTGLMIVFLLIMVTMVLLLKQQSIKQKESVRKIVQDAKTSIVTRAELAKELKKAVQNINEHELIKKEKYKIEVDEVTAELTLPEDFIRFESDKSSLNSRSIQNLNIFLPEYLCALHRFENNAEKKYSKIRNVFINGFADTEGDTLWNSPLSTNRAREVVSFAMQMLRCEINKNDEEGIYFSHRTKSNLLNQKMQIYSCDVFFQTQKDIFPANCVAHTSSILNDIELKLKGIGYGDSEHCKKLIRNGQGNNCRENSFAEPNERKVTFSVDIMGDDMTDLVAHLVELGGIVELKKEELEGLMDINENILQRCLQDEISYDGCLSTFIGFANNECKEGRKQSSGCIILKDKLLQNDELKYEFCGKLKENSFFCGGE